MTTTPRDTPWTSKAIVITTALLLVQFAAAYIIGSGHLLTNDSQLLFPPIAITVTVPVVGFLVAYALSPGVRSFVLGQDIRVLTMMQLWRVIGFTFLTLYWFDVLPGLFALPAGFGDVAVGIAALFVASRIYRDESYVRSSAFVGFHIMGLIDFLVAIVAVGLTAGAFPSLISGDLTSSAMDVWPLNIFPSFGVPFFIILHLIVLFQVGEARRVAREHVNGEMVAT